MCVSLQAAQTSALSDRQVEQRRILELENVVKTVSKDSNLSTWCVQSHHFHRAPVTSSAAQLERERHDLRSQMRLLKECGDAAKEELNARSAAHIQTAEEVAQKRAESSALRFAWA